MKLVKITILDRSKASDEEVVARVLQGEKELYELLMRRHNQRLYRTIRSYLRNESEVEDTMQDTYLIAYEKLHQFRNDAQFSTWLIRIGINAALGKLRENKKFALAPIAIETLHKDNTPLLSESALMSPENITIRKEVKQLLEKAIDNIPEKYKIVYVLREVEEISIKKIAQCLDISESNVKIRLHRAKIILKEALYKLSIDQNVFEFGFKRCDSIVNKVMRSLS